MKKRSDIYPAIVQALQSYYGEVIGIEVKIAMERDVSCVLQEAVNCGLLDAGLWGNDHKISVTQTRTDGLDVELPYWITVALLDSDENTNKQS